jgi:sterol 14-demethylase
MEQPIQLASNPALKNGTELTVLPSILIIIASFVVLSVLVHILGQLLFRNKDEPPLVFSWFPILGSTIEYGIDPYKFFFKYREKVINTFVLYARSFRRK